MTTTHTMANGKQRKTLASQLDRLDTILDGLSDAIPEVIADTIRVAVTQAIQQAVQQVIREVLTNPEVLAQLRARLMPPAAQRPSRGARWRQRLVWLGGRIHAARQATGQAAQRMLRRSCDFVDSMLSLTRLGLQGLWHRTRRLMDFKVPLLLSLVVGTTVGVATYHAGPVLAAVVSGLGGFALTWLIQIAIVLRRLFGTVQPTGSVPVR